MKRLWKHLGWDDITVGFLGLIAIILSILDFTPFVEITNDPALRMLIFLVGLLIGSFVVQAGRRKAEVDELRQAVGQVEAALLNMKTEFPENIAQRARTCRKFILDTDLNSEVPRVDFASPQEHYRQILEKRLERGEIAFLEVVCVFHRETFMRVVEYLCRFKDKEYYVRHYPTPPKAIPIIHVMSFDNEHWYIGGFHPVAPIAGEEIAAYIRHPAINRLLADYWNVLWANAIPLKEGKKIYVERLQQIAEHLGVTREEFKEMVAPLTL